MKKLVLLALGVLATATVWAAPDFPKVDFPKTDFPKADFPKTDFPANSLESKIASHVPVNEFAHDAAVFDMELTVHSKFKEQLQGDFEQIFRKPCSAVLIDKNWLLASLSCRGMGQYDIAEDHNGNGWEKEVAYRHIKKAAIRSKYFHQRDSIYPRDIFIDESSQLILLRIDRTNEDLADEVDYNKTVVARLFVPKNPENLTETFIEKHFENAFINRERPMAPGRTSDGVTVLEYCTDSRCYNVEWEAIDGDSGDPLLAVSAKDLKTECLLGFNNAKMVGATPESGRKYRALTQGSLNFIKKIVGENDPKAWQRIANGVKNEKNF